MALTPRNANASPKRSTGTRRPTNASSTSGQRARARSSASTAASQSTRLALTLPTSARFCRIASTPMHRAVEGDLLRAPVDAQQAGDAVAAEQPQRVGHDLGVAGGLHDEVEAADVLGQRAGGVCAVHT